MRFQCRFEAVGLISNNGSAPFSVRERERERKNMDRTWSCAQDFSSPASLILINLKLAPREANAS